MLFYAAQLALNLLWQPIFFLLKRPGVAQLEIAGVCVCVRCEEYMCVRCEVRAVCVSGV